MLLLYFILLLLINTSEQLDKFQTESHNFTNFTTNEDDEHWGYERSDGELDPGHWYQKYNSCIGHRQSPIDIERDDVIYDPTLKPLVLKGYNVPIPEARLINNGHSVEVEMLDDDTDKKVISIPLLNMTYKLVQFHFHWSQDDKDGSEHAIFNEHFPLEMHLVHVEEGVTFDEALSEPFGLLVLSVFFKLGKQNSELLKLTNKFDQIEDPLKNSWTTVQNIDLRHLLPRDVMNYLHYPGSLTSPPCNEVVQWVILTHVCEISHEQLQKFRSLKHKIVKNGKTAEVEIKSNVRNVQSLEGRKVKLHYWFDELDSHNSMMNLEEFFNTCVKMSESQFLILFAFILLYITINVNE